MPPGGKAEYDRKAKIYISNDFASRFLVALGLRQHERGEKMLEIKDTNTDGFSVCAQEPLHLLFHIGRLNVLQDKSG